jgi:hypothetical protein
LYQKITDLEEEYKQFQSIKKTNKELYNECILFNQQILIFGGKIHRRCLDNWNNGGKEFYEEFITNTYEGIYYKEWRKSRAVSIASCSNSYDLLGIKWKSGEIIGETFFAGIPPVTEEEVKAAKCMDEKYCFLACSEKIGNDGKYHPVDEQGNFEYPYDPEKPFGD